MAPADRSVDLLPVGLGRLGRDGRLLLLARFLRLFAYGALSVVLVFYLIAVGLTEIEIGLLLTLTLAGDTIISLCLTTRADRFGRRRILCVGAALMAGGGLAFASTTHPSLLMIAGTIGVISPSGHEVGPLLPVEQAALAQVVSARNRTDVFAWYALAGSVATAIGALAGGAIGGAAGDASVPPVGSYRAVVLMYVALGAVLAWLFTRLSPATENVRRSGGDEAPVNRFSGLGRSGRTVAALSGLFALDAFAGGFVVQSFAAYWFHLRFGMGPAALGVAFFGANVAAGLSALAAARIAARIGLVNTMVATHLPSNVLLVLVPLMPTAPLAVGVLLLRFSISQMDVPARQAFVMGVVRADERSAAAGITGVARTIGAAASPLFVGVLFSRPDLINAPFFIAGALKIVYDLALYATFAAPPFDEIVDWVDRDESERVETLRRMDIPPVRYPRTSRCARFNRNSACLGQTFQGPMPGHNPSMPWHWDLHVWVCANNPSGMFAQWNPSLQCDGRLADYRLERARAMRSIIRRNSPLSMPSAPPP